MRLRLPECEFSAVSDPGPRSIDVWTVFCVSGQVERLLTFADQWCDTTLTIALRAGGLDRLQQVSVDRRTLTTPQTTKT
jgi:hypothetical protein